jgi:SAM-dependent methyltransferase
MTLLGPESPGSGERLSNAPANVIEFARLGSPSSQTSRSWVEFYEGRDTGTYRNYVRRQYKPFLDAIRIELDRAQGPETVLEVGCGIGTISHILTRHGDRRYDNTYLALDSDPRMLATAEGYIGDRCRVIRGDMRSHAWLKADIIHGHGVLEHLDDHGIYQTLEAHQRSGARAAIHYVPGAGWGKPSFGDERLLPFHWWVDKWEPHEAISFNGARDYVLIWRF